MSCSVDQVRDHVLLSLVSVFAFHNSDRVRSGPGNPGKSWNLKFGENHCLIGKMENRYLNSGYRFAHKKINKIAKNLNLCCLLPRALTECMID